MNNNKNYYNLNKISNKLNMYSFIICFAALIASYFIYGKIIEKVAGVDENNSTPVQRLEDGVDYMPLSTIKAYLIHFLNIAGLGPIFGVIQGALFWSSSIFMDYIRYDFHRISSRFLLRIYVNAK